MLTSESRLRDFPSLASMAYLNTAAESIPPACVREAVNEYLDHKSLGMKGRDHHFARVESCREIAARTIGMAPEEVAFCSCSSEAYNLLASALALREGDEVVVTDLDFPAGATPWLTARERPVLKLWQHRDGALEVSDLPALLNERTRLVQVSLISFYNGFRMPWCAFADAVRKHAPNALISVDVTQALGRVALDCSDADVIISSTHKWSLALHGGCIVGIAKRAADRLTTHAGGWFHISNAFDADRFTEARVKHGAASFAVGMPNFATIYALNASLRYLESIGVDAIEAHANPLVEQAAKGLRAAGITLMAPLDQRANPTGIIAFQHAESARLHDTLQAASVHVMHHAGRIRVAVHGYNTAEDIQRLTEVVRDSLRLYA